MAEDSYLKKLVKKALLAAASAGGSKIGGKAASYVLDILGLGGNELDEIQETINTISAQVKKTDDKISALMDEVKWANATDSFDIICATITTHSKRIVDLLGIPDGSKRDAQIKKYITTANPPINALDTNLTLIDNRIMGAGDGITGTHGAPLMKTYLDMHWASLWDKNPAQCYANILAVYLQCAQMQRLATTLLVAYWEATDQNELAQKAPEDLEKRLVAQFQVMAQAMPDFVALNALTTPGLQVKFSSLYIAPAYTSIVKNYLTPVSEVDLTTWRLIRIGADPATPTYTLTIGSDWGFIETIESLLVGKESVGEGLKPVHATAHLLQFVSATSASLLHFSIEATDQINVLRFILPDGHTLGYINRERAGYRFELTSTEATTTNGLVTCSKFLKAPREYPPTLSAWSRAFSPTSDGEGRFAPGYRVRYRVIHVNRFGESHKSAWLPAQDPVYSQDNEGYFGHPAYYFPQISLFDPTGLTEAYRIFRQFEGWDEEDVTAGGTFTGDPQSGKPVIFDDFMP